MKLFVRRDYDDAAFPIALGLVLLLMVLRAML